MATSILLYRRLSPDHRAIKDSLGDLKLIQELNVDKNNQNVRNISMFSLKQTCVHILCQKGHHTTCIESLFLRKYKLCNTTLLVGNS